MLCTFPLGHLVRNYCLFGSQAKGSVASEKLPFIANQKINTRGKRLKMKKKNRTAMKGQDAKEQMV